MVNAAELIARVRQRKLELQEKQTIKSWEWWDHAPSRNIYHPSCLDPIENNFAFPESLQLTKDERKRQRKLNRLKDREDQRKRIELGISKPPPPKLSRKNVAAVYGAAYIQDPTKHELIAAEAEEERRRAHLEANESRKLSSDEKWEKARALVENHRKEALHCVAVYIKRPLTSKEQFVIDSAAKKLLCTGMCLHGDLDAFVIIESGEPELQKLKKVLIEKLGGCIVWEGKLPQANFRRWSVHSNPNRRELLRPYNVESIYVQAIKEFAGAQHSR